MLMEVCVGAEMGFARDGAELECVVGLWPSTTLLWKAVMVSVLPRVRGVCWEGIPGRWISREQWRHRCHHGGSGDCATDD